MSDISKNTPAAGGATPAMEEKTFTQDDVNRIVQDRLSKERTKGEAEILQREHDLARREFVLSARETLTAKGLSHTLLDALNTTSPEAFESSVAAVEELIKEREQRAFHNRPPAYAAGTGTTPMLGSRDDEVRQAMGLK